MKKIIIATKINTKKKDFEFIPNLPWYLSANLGLVDPPGVPDRNVTTMKVRINIVIYNYTALRL